jgi:hypothetical protein
VKKDKKTQHKFIITAAIVIILILLMAAIVRLTDDRGEYSPDKPMNLRTVAATIINKLHISTEDQPAGKIDAFFPSL